MAMQLRLVSINLFCLVLAYVSMPVGAMPVMFSFESGNSSGSVGDLYGSQDPASSPPLSRNGFIVDVAPTPAGTPTPALHFHEVDSTLNSKVPDRPVAEKGVLWRDSVAGQDPVVFAPETPTFIFSLESLVVGASSADLSQTTSVGLSAFLAGSLLGTVDLLTTLGSYTSYSGAALGALDGLLIDRLEFTGLSNNSTSYYMLDNVAFQTEALEAVPEPTSIKLIMIGLLLFAGISGVTRGIFS